MKFIVALLLAALAASAPTELEDSTSLLLAYRLNVAADCGQNATSVLSEVVPEEQEPSAAKLLEREEQEPSVAKLVVRVLARMPAKVDSASYLAEAARTLARARPARVRLVRARLAAGSELC